MSTILLVLGSLNELQFLTKILQGLSITLDKLTKP